MVRYGRIDALVNNAAIGPLGNVLQTTEDVWDRVMAVNLKGIYLCCRAVLLHMIARGGGAIVNIGSGAGWGKPNMAAYAASKGGLLALSAALAYDHFADHVRINTVIPGGGGIVAGMSLGRVGGDIAKIKARKAAGTAARPQHDSAGRRQRGGLPDIRGGGRNFWSRAGRWRLRASGRTGHEGPEIPPTQTGGGGFPLR
jgi:NAD(P)-dependent dehydrogenase (short-subunit alcohol dehydrogenase family)